MLRRSATPFYLILVAGALAGCSTLNQEGSRPVLTGAKKEVPPATVDIRLDAVVAGKEELPVCTELLSGDKVKFGDRMSVEDILFFEVQHL